MIVDTTGGRVRGAGGGFEGIPYGRAERFQAPEPATWSGTRDALDFGPSCPQPTSPPGIDWACARLFPESEDCLTLNVWTPGLDGRRPVLVWLHGGGLHSGSASQPLYDGAALAGWGDVVVVSVNHRLSSFGFTHLGGRSGNAGLLDLVLALEWVRDNIAAFGGDPGNVTLFGQSGGGGKVVGVLAMPAAKGLVHRAVAQSGSLLRTGTRVEPGELARLLTVEAGTTDLASLPTGELLAATERLLAKVGVMAFGPVVNDDLPMEPGEALASGATADVPLLVGVTSGEYLSAGARMGDLDDAVLPAVLANVMPADEAAELLPGCRERFPDATGGELFGRLFTEWSQQQVLATLDAARTGGQPAWGYRFDFGGAPHGAELPLVFRHPDPFPGEPAPPPALVDEVSGTWVRFARTGDPGWPEGSTHVFG
ncbi:MAG: Carboxylesterase type [Actinomycetia bacterium]|nr:Carboxylesterase type [Actinomycetes bacterium]